MAKDSILEPVGFVRFVDVIQHWDLNGPSPKN
jgi:hypothetical protein